VVVADPKFTKFEQISMKASDMQFLQGIEATDTEICNFFGLPMYKLNQGKQSFQSNEQQNIDYLNTTLDPYLVQYEQAAALSWLSTQEQGITYFRFNRDVLLRTAAAARTDVLVKKIQSGQLSPNEARGIEDQSAYEGGDGYFMPANIQPIGSGGNKSLVPAGGK
jgi:HK97 family phage portal protein